MVYIGKLSNSLSLSALCSANASHLCNTLQLSLSFNFLFLTAQQLQGIFASYTHIPALPLVPSGLTKLPHPASLGSFICITNFLDSKVSRTCSVHTRSCRSARSEGSVGKTDGHKSNPNTMLHTYARQPKVVYFLILSWRCPHRGRGSSWADMQNSLPTIWACSRQEPPKPRTST